MMYKAGFVVKASSLLLILCLSACSKRITVQKTAYADVTEVPYGFRPSSSFVVMPKEKKHELLEKEVGQKISMVLEDQGYTVKKNLEDATYCVTFDYGMKSEIKTVHTPKYIPGETVTTTGHASGADSSFSRRGGYQGHQQQDVAYTETTRLPDKLVYVPERAIEYTKNLHVYVYDAKEYAKARSLPALLWEGIATSVDDDANLRATLDFLILDVMDSFGENTSGNACRSWKANDKDAVQLRNDYLRPVGRYR